MSEFPTPYIVPPRNKHTHTIILLHGRGSNGPDFAEELFESRTSSGLSLIQLMQGWKWVFLSSKRCYSTVFEEEIDQWFDIYSLTNPSAREELQVQGLEESVAFVRVIMEQEIVVLGCRREKLVVGGISQGCAVAIRAVLTTAKIGAFLGFCGWMPFPSDVRDDYYGKDTPVFLSHARNDAVVDFELGMKLRMILADACGMKVTWKGYGEGGHWINEPEGFDDWTNFLTDTLGPAAFSNVNCSGICSEKHDTRSA